MGNLTKFQSKGYMTYCIIKVKCTWVHDPNLRTLIAIIVLISNTRGFGAFFTKYTYNNNIYIYYIYYLLHLYVYLLKMNTSPEINAGNSLGVCAINNQTYNEYTNANFKCNNIL